MSLGLLPREIIIAILRLSTVETIMSFQTVSRTFFAIVKESALLQHIILLRLCGHIRPLVSLEDVSLVEKNQMLRDNQSRRTELCHIQPSQINVQVSKIQGLGVNLNGYHEGVYAQYCRATRHLNFYQFQSLNHGTETSSWSHQAPPVPVVGLAIEANIDLLVWLEARHQNPFQVQTRSSQDYRYKIHLRSMRSNTEHPEAFGGPITHHFTAARTITVHNVHVLGNLLAVLFVSVRARHPCYAVVWDWTAGVELARVTTPGGKHTSLAFLSERLFIITRNSYFFENGIKSTNNIYGQLDIYSLDMLWSENTVTIAHPVMQLLLPSLPQEVSGAFIHIRSAHLGYSTYVCPSSRPRLYDIPPSSQTLCLDVETWPFQHSRYESEPRGTLLIPVVALLKACAPLRTSTAGTLESYSLAALPWTDWAHETYWNDSPYMDTITPHAAYKRQFAQLQANPDLQGAEGLNGIAIWEFDKPPPIEQQTPAVGLHPTADGFFATQVAPMRGESTMIQPDAMFLPLTCVILDSEYLIAQTSWEEDGYTLLVYHF